MPLGDEAAALVSGRLQTALLRESVALVEGGTATPRDVDSVVTTTIGRRLAVGGPFEIWEQIGWDLVQVIAGALLKEISNAVEISASLESTLHQTVGDRATRVLETGADPALIRNVAVIGAGLMGHGIALEFAASGRAVRLHDLSAELLDDAMKRADVGLQALTRTGRFSASDVNASLDRIRTTTNLADCVGAADLVVEAASENLALKKKIFEQLDVSAPAHAILVSNTSTFLPSVYASSTNCPERVVGVHYYNPPHLLPGVEIIRGPETSDQTATTVVALYKSIGKKPAVIQKEIQGFIGNRLQVALLREAMSIVESGIATASEVDELVRTTFGKDLSNAGPFELARSAGLSATMELFEANLSKLSSSRELPDLLCERVESGRLKRFSDSPCTAWARRGTSACTNAGGPMQAYSMDLRERALLDSDAGMKAADVAVKYRVSGSWVRLLKQRRRETGEVAPRVQRHGRRRMLEPHLHTLAALIAEQPDRTLAELKDALGTPASLATIWRAVAALDVTVKKNGPALRTRST